MKNIRRGVFETNSSSTHSVTISGFDLMLDVSLVPDINGNIIIQGKEFGWKWEKFNDAYSKASYCFLNFKERREELKEIIKKQTGANNVIFDEHDGYIDHVGEHCSIEKIEDFHFFIFNKNSWLFLGNDNEYAPNEFYDLPGTKYNYLLTTEGLPFVLKWKFKDLPTDEDAEEAISSLVQNIRFNQTKNCWERDWIFSNSREVYYIYSKYYLPAKNNKIVFLKDNLYHEAYKLKTKVSELILKKENQIEISYTIQKRKC